MSRKVDGTPRTTPLRYPRDPMLAPQFVWDVKDEQDAEDHALPAVPIYVPRRSSSIRWPSPAKTLPILRVSYERPPSA